MKRRNALWGLLSAVPLYGLYRWQKTSVLGQSHGGGLRSSSGMAYQGVGGGSPVVVLDQDDRRALILTQPLQRAPFHIVCVSRPGYGGTALEVGRSPDQQAAAVVDLMHDLDLPKAVVIGIGGGTWAALTLALHYPERCAALVVIAPQMRPKVEEPTFFSWLRATALSRGVAVSYRLWPDPQTPALLRDLWMWMPSDQAGVKNDLLFWEKPEIPADWGMSCLLIGEAQHFLPQAQFVALNIRQRRDLVLHANRIWPRVAQFISAAG